MRPFPCLLLCSALIAGSSSVAGNALAFSQFEDSNGSYGGSKDGIIAVPLPPLPGSKRERAGPNLPPDTKTNQPPQNEERHRTGQPKGSGRTGEAIEGTDQGEVPISPEDEDAIAPAPAPARNAPPERRREDPSASTPAGYQADTGTREQPGTGPRVGRPSAAGTAAPRSEADAPAIPLASDIGYGEDKLPAPVRETRRKLMEAARTGEIERLRPLIETGDDGTLLSFADTPADPIEFLRQGSGDGAGIETLAIMLDLLRSGYSRLEPGTDDEIFVWPYFTQVDIAKLTKPQMVELFQIVTAGDYQAMLDFGAYNFYRIGITPDGKLQFFVAGD
ncbi:hypothetical protein [Jiella mangrovi]|uniref:Uncharacterized protein n=1 Tax=Jiella mangrovi TaxID=2821407 RepID=A0ABS4BCL4_9HYPH|nr:hypothetical protein [Jiella mangrovi]MBP0614272.1 hypothetical protein [Jiella mangrovi]